MSPPLKSPGPIGEGDSVQDIYKKQAVRIEQLERDNKRLETELKEKLKALHSSEAEIENLEEAQDEVADLKIKAAKAYETTTEVEKLVRLTAIPPLRRLFRSAISISDAFRDIRSPKYYPCNARTPTSSRRRPIRNDAHLPRLHLSLPKMYHLNS